MLKSKNSSFNLFPSAHSHFFLLFMLKIAILGPESTGKTEIAQALSNFYKAPWIPEYAREYVEKLDREYTHTDVCNIAQKQIAQEKEVESDLSATTNYVFFDTDLIITKVWFEYKYGATPSYVLEQLESGFFDAYLLCAPDLAWQADPVREHGDDREFFFNWYKTEIEKLNKPYTIITGNGTNRIQNAIAAVEHFNSTINIS